MTLGATVDGFEWRSCLPEVVMNCAFAGNMFGTWPVTTLAVYAHLDVFQSQSPIIDRQVA
jgi:hypothetical protein